MFIYGSILIAVTFSPIVFKINLVDEAIRKKKKYK